MEIVGENNLVYQTEFYIVNKIFGLNFSRCRFLNMTTKVLIFYQLRNNIYYAF